MQELVDAVTNPWLFLLVLLVFGLLPKLCLRLLLYAFRSDDAEASAARDEIWAAFCAIEDYWKKPFFVLEHVENVIFEGLVPRFRDRQRVARGELSPLTSQVLGSTQLTMDSATEHDLLALRADGQFTFDWEIARGRNPRLTF